MKTTLITIFTPTYNRAYILPALYKSLTVQTSKNFEWVVVNDGSTDNTDELLEKWQNEHMITITAISTSNGGKQRAINKGVQTASGELLFIVDSDDYLTPDAVETIENDWVKLKISKNGYSGLYYKKIIYTTQKIIGRRFPEPPVAASSLQMVYQYGVKGDKAEIFKTESLKKIPFPEINGEKFIPEAYIWNKITEQLPLIFFNKGIYMCEYLKDVITANISKCIKQNPKGFALYYREILRYHIVSIKDKIKAAIRLLQCKIYQLAK